MYCRIMLLELGISPMTLKILKNYIKQKKINKKMFKNIVINSLKNDLNAFTYYLSRKVSFFLKVLYQTHSAHVLAQ